MPTPQSLSTALLGRTIEVGGNRYRLLKPLGSGATAVVFQGEKTDEVSGSKKKSFAIKLTIDEKNAIAERDNLFNLNKVQTEHNKNVFPILHYPTKASEPLKQSYYVGRHVAPKSDGRLTVFVLVQGLVQGESVRDMLLYFPDTLAMPEPLALAIAQQYARMLELAHEAGITSWDRKLGDLRWSWTQSPSSYSPTVILQQWRKDDLGNLKVIDWNVTDLADNDNKAKDLFRFGLLWHRMLLGVEPKFRSGEETWQLLPLESHAAWNTLSFGMQRILEKLLHPNPEKRYQRASDLKKDLETIIGGWKKSPEPLWKEDIEPIYNNLAKSSRKSIRNAMALASTLVLRRDKYKDKITFPISRAKTVLRRALAIDKDLKLKDYITRGKWPEAAYRLNTLFADVHKPIKLLLRHRYDFIIEAARHSFWERNDFVDQLIGFSSAIYNYDLSSGEDRAGKLKGEVETFQKVSPPMNSGDNWEKVRNAFVATAEYRLNIHEGMRAYAQAEFEEAREKLQAAVGYRDRVKNIHSEQLALLDQVWENPEWRLENIKDKLEKIGERKTVLERGLMALKTSGAALDASTETIQAFLRAHPYDVLVGSLLFLLENWRQYVQQDVSDLPMRIILLRRAEDAWRDFRKMAVKDKDIKDRLKAIDDKFSRGWSTLKIEIEAKYLTLSDANFEDIQAKTGEKTGEVTGNEMLPAVMGWRSGRVCWLYRDSTPDEKFSDQVDSYLKMLRKEISQLLPSLKENKGASSENGITTNDESSYSFAEGEIFIFDEERAKRAVALATLGHAFAQSWGHPGLWQDEYSPEKVTKQLQTARQKAQEISFLRAVYETALLSFTPVVWEESE